MKDREHRGPEAVLAELAWVRALARRLCVDTAAADDLSQEVLLAGLAEPPRPGIPLRRWLAGIARRKAKMARRGASRRAFHEGLAPPRDQGPDTPELLQRLEEHRRVSDAVAGLREPYRTALLQRYVEDRSPTEIARRSGEPLSSVKTRLARALSLLRDELERTGGKDWSLALLPLARLAPLPGAVKLPLALGATLSIKHLLAALIIALLALAGYFTLAQPMRTELALHSTQSAELAAAPLDVAELEGPAALEQVDSQDALRSRVDPVAAVDEAATLELPSAKSAPITAPDSVRLRVIAKTPFGQPLAGAVIRQVSLNGLLAPLPGQKWTLKEKLQAEWSPDFSSERDIGTTGVDGELIVDVARSPSSNFRVQDPALVHLIEGSMLNVVDQEYSTVIVAGGVRALDGTVTAMDGSPIQGATVTLIYGIDFSARFGMPVAALDSQHIASVESDENGRFEFPSCAETPKVMVKVEAPGFKYQLTAAPDRGDATLAIVLTQARQGETVLRGRVVCSDGSSSVGAWVACAETHHSTLVTEESGAFELLFDGREAVIHAVLPGLLPVKYVHAPKTPWPEELVLTLGEQALFISGVVVDEAGRPLKGRHVGVMDGTAFGVVQVKGEGYSQMRRLEDMGVESGAAVCTTDSKGRFSIHGLLARPYRLLAQEQKTLRGVVSIPIQAGQTGVKLVLNRKAPSGPIAGRVTNGAGLPLADISIWPSRSFGVEGSFNIESNRLPSNATSTDEDGRFRIAESAYDDVSLHASGGLNYAAVSIPLTEITDPQEIEMVIRKNTPFTIRWAAGAAPAGAIWMFLEDEDGEQVMMLRPIERGSSGAHEVLIQSVAATPVLYVPQGSYDVVLKGSQNEIQRFHVVIEGESQQTIHR